MRYGMANEGGREGQGARTKGRPRQRVARFAGLLAISLLIATILPGLSGTASAQVGTPITVFPTLLRDSWTDTANPDTNHGSNTILSFGQNGIGPFYHTLIEWDVSGIPSGATILDANLTVQTIDTGTATFESEVRTITEAWSESTVTSNNEPAFSSTVFDRFDNDVETSGVRSKNITNSVQALIGTATFGLAFLNDSTPNKFQEWRSSEHTIGPNPVLEVTYIVQPPSAIAVLIAIATIVVGMGFVVLVAKKERTLEDLGVFILLIFIFVVVAGVAVVLFAGG